jgi:hypothetical protein
MLILIIKDQLTRTILWLNNDGFLEIGTEDEKYSSKLTITMHGSKDSSELPVYGNKGIFVKEGTLDIHGIERISWTFLDVTVDIGSSEITLIKEVNWEIGNQIVIASTSFESTQAEQFEIQSIATVSGKSVITLNKATQYKHFAETQEFTSGSLTK